MASKVIFAAILSLSSQIERPRGRFMLLALPLIRFSN